ncbi:hypothetical protein QJS10_CPA06g01493 [Acorus calamus]|uniref:DUF4283 domain-containing protein n=1 Tax=Acorus calamus TaxID=4465 RepID=A0AAV9ERE7_ACOCL|nr:hypothetical protein QJS10_CPA06g01493 [Acorus calamus]
MGAGGFQMQVLLRGLPMVWQTEGCLRKVVEPFGSLLNYIEILDCEEFLPPAKVTVWVSKEGRPPRSMLVILGGGSEVKVQVDQLPSLSSSSYADKVRFGHRRSPIRVAREVGGSRQPEVAPKGPPMAMDGGGEGGSGDGPAVQQSSPVPEKVDDVISSGNPDCQTSIHEASSVLPTGALSTGHVVGGSPSISGGGRSGRVRGRSGSFRCSSDSDYRGGEQWRERRSDVCVTSCLKRQVAGPSIGRGTEGRNVGPRGSRPTNGPDSTRLPKTGPHMVLVHTDSPRNYNLGSDMALVHTDSFLLQPVKGRANQKAKLKSIVVSQREHQAGPSGAAPETGLERPEVDPAPEVVPSALLSQSMTELPKASQGNSREVDEVHILKVSGAPTIPNSQLQGEVSPPVAIKYEDMEFLGSPACVKASQIGMIFENESDKFQFKSFLHKSRIASTSSLPLGHKQQAHT